MTTVDQLNPLLMAREAAKYLRVSAYTLGKIERLGLLKPYRTPGGHRRYTRELLDEYLEHSRDMNWPIRDPKEAYWRGKQK